jgi:C4-dicarboxylate transporter DctQ subunit
MIIGSQLVRHDGHVRPDLVLRLMPASAQRWVELFNCLVAIAFTGGMVWYGWDVVSTAVVLDQRSSSDLQFPMWIYYLALPTGGGLMLLRYIIRLVRYAIAFDPKTMTVGHNIAHEAPAELAMRVVE